MKHRALAKNTDVVRGAHTSSPECRYITGVIYMLCRTSNLECRPIIISMGFYIYMYSVDTFMIQSLNNTNT